MNYIVFKWCSNEKIPEDLYLMTSELVGYSRIDNFAIYRIEFIHGLGILKSLLSENKNVNVFSEVSKHLRKFKIQKIIHKANGKEYKNKDLDKFSTFLQYYYDEKGNINIIEQIG